jgi:protein-disulfide isomerase
MSKREEIKANRRKNQNRQRLFIFGGVIVVALVVLAVLIFSTQQKSYSSRPKANGTAMGDPNAPVKVEEFSDFQCPYCRMFYKELEPTIVKDYVSTGKVYFVYVPLSFIGAESVAAAEASHCAADQNKFWEFHDMAFNNQGGENSGIFTTSALAGYAQTIGLNMDQYNSCVSSNKYAQKVKDDAAYATSKSVNSTPSFLVGTKVVGMDSLKDTIDAALAGK